MFDPPKIASKQRDVGRARKAMERSLVTLLPRLIPSGIIAVCSCSHHIGVASLDISVGRASHHAGVSMVRVGLRGAGSDHPICPLHTEGHYLTVALYLRR